jgi:predicted  nucleic acid-binding Zn-ribbon protein
MSKTLIGISILLLSFSVLFGFLNTGKVKRLNNDLATAGSAREMAERSRLASERKLKAQEKDFAEAANKTTAAEAKASSAEADLTKAQNTKAELESKLQASEGQIADLQKRVADATVAVPGAPEGMSPNELKALLDDTKHQLETAEQEKTILGDKVKSAQDRVAAMEEEKKRRESGQNPAGVHGTVLAVNQAYNFVVLNMGDRQGVVPNSEMLVLRQGALIGKIRISSVEPTTSIGDIITNSLARGVQVQPGDIVVYAGSTNS